MNGKVPGAWENCPRIETQFVGTKKEGKLILGIGVSEEAGKLMKALGVKRALVVADRFMAQNGTAEGVRLSLLEEGIESCIFHEITGEPTEETVYAALSAAGEGCDGVLGLGGGSAMDVAKLSAVCLKERVSPDDVLSLDGKTLDALPLLLMPTTAGTGSEVSPYAVFTLHGQKKFLTAPAIYPTVALVDPALAETLPPDATAYTALDALTHGIEGCCGKSNPITMAFASECARRIFHALPIAFADGSRLDARYDLACAAVLGMMAYTQGGGLYAHSMSYLLPMLPHGKGCALALPYTMAMNGEKIGPVTDMLEKAVGCEKGGFPEALRALIAHCGLPGTLKEIGIPEEKKAEIAAALLERYPRKNNPLAYTLQDAEKLVSAMYAGTVEI